MEYKGQSGALNEHLADVFGEYVEYKIKGDTRLEMASDANFAGSDAPMRDFRNPEKGVFPQPSHMSQIQPGQEFAEYGDSCVPDSTNDGCGVHVLSGILNKAFSEMIQSSDWETVMNIYYPVMVLRLHTQSNFKNFRAQMKEECLEQYDSSTCVKIIDKSFDLVGI